ncbi:NmrA family transcriptional regulator [Streptomyces sp. AS58]|uniref:SDR family oxidoreductase n=1 Tax=Streptomyces sp. AS58 TaxID=1519489 RepID=UPI0006B06457|nr:SDR family oxidoreductase [Streptomyces sp. AS58]KOV52614.1 NmrA family transcriptional regulator [Streptomyces sp. AS58]
MKVVVIGGTGLIGSKLVGRLADQGHEAIAASPSTGVNASTGEGLAEVLQEASVVVDVSNAPSWEEEAVMSFFRTGTTNLLKAEAEAGVQHHVVLSIVGTERLQEKNSYIRAKHVQENLIKTSGIPYSIVRATQFFELLGMLAEAEARDDGVHVAPVKIRPIHADDVAAAIARVAVGTPVNGTIEVAGPEEFRFDELIRETLSAKNDSRTVVPDPGAGYFGAPLEETTLLPAAGAGFGKNRYADWLAQQK